MNPRPSDRSRQPEAVDEVMLAVLANRGRDAAVLSEDLERLLGDWVAGRLAPDDAARAADLVRQNTLAVERVLELRLRTAASRSPPVPQHLTARILRASAPRRASAKSAWWHSLGRRQWSIVGAAALASTLVVVARPMLQQLLSGNGPLQVAMVTIDDRSPLFEASDRRMRGTGAPPAPAADQRFRDVDVPAGVLKSVLSAASAPSSAAGREIEAFLPALGDVRGQPIRIIVDTALREKVDALQSGDRVPVRIYDLRDPRNAEIRAAVRSIPDSRRAYLLTIKP